jgi:ribosomal protein S18 acetylase RimI-like enzyme
MDYAIRQLTSEDEPLLWEILYYGLSSGTNEPPPRDVVHRPEISRYVEGWGRAGDSGFVAHDKKNRALLGAAWLRQPTDESDVSPELALAVKPEHRRHGIGTALLTISISFVAGKPVLRLYERFGFKVVEQRPDAVVMHRPA